MVMRTGAVYVNKGTEYLGPVLFSPQSRPAERGSSGAVLAYCQRLVIQLRGHVSVTTPIADDDILVLMYDGGVWQAIIIDTLS
jgi:hypothetical protein